MDLTPQSTRSPTPPSRSISNPQPRYEYPSPAPSVSNHPSSESRRGIGSLLASYSGNLNEEHSPFAANSSECKWPAAGNHHRNTSGSSLSTPNNPSAVYDPFAPCPTNVTSIPPYSYDIYSSQTAEVTVPPASPLLSGNSSQRSSFSSVAASEIPTQASSVHSYTPKIKMENHNGMNDYITGSESMMMSSPQLSNNLAATDQNSYPGSLSASYYPEQNAMAWSKMDYGDNNNGLPSISSLPLSHYDRRSESCERGSASDSKSRNPSTATRVRQPRRLTTKEDANHQCHVKGCEKFFGRSYNYKAHMETHVMGREYPFPCSVQDCAKKFVRKTDLQRHNASVHMKEKNHKCDYCARHFARKDTLRRHMDDGCAKRFDIETVDFRPGQLYGNNEQSNSMGGPAQSRASDVQQRHASYSSSAQYSPPPAAGTLTSGTYLGRPEYQEGDATQDSW